MAKTEHLYRRGGIYYWRRRLPLNLSSKIGREDVARSLLTADPKDARRRSRRLSAATDEFFVVAQSDSSLTPETINQILQDILRTEIEDAERAIASARPRSREESDDYVEVLRDHREEHQRDLSENHLRTAYRWADDALAERGITADKSSQEYRDLCRGILIESDGGAQLVRELTQATAEKVRARHDDVIDALAMSCSEVSSWLLNDRTMQMSGLRSRIEAHNHLSLRHGGSNHPLYEAMMATGEAEAELGSRISEAEARLADSRRLGITDENLAMTILAWKEDLEKLRGNLRS